MIKRTIDISEEAYLHIKNHQLMVVKKKQIVGQIPIEDLGILILQHPAIVLTQQLIIACQKNNTVIIFCDEKHLPYSVILPISEGNNLHNKILKQQVNITEPTRKRLWKRIVEQKIKQQASTLTRLDKDATRLNYLAANVKSGDSTNREAIAAQSYWKLLFGDSFRRNPNAEGVNTLLNYGYAIIRAMIARGICATGLHPSIGLFHQNQYNSLCLADDLMEPLRPLVDFMVFQLAEDGLTTIGKETKQVLLGLLSVDMQHEGKKMPLMIATHYLMSDFKRCISKEKRHFTYPQLIT